MIREIEIQNFRCFEYFRAKDCRRINVIVGDNGTGKTALLEAIFLPLAVTTEIALRFRQQRGLEGGVSGSPRAIQDALFGDFFYQRDIKQPIQIQLSGTGPEARSVEIGRGDGQTMLEEIEKSETTGGSKGLPIVFTWKDAAGARRSATLGITSQGLSVGSTGEDYPDFFFFSATTAINSVEVADRFSQLSRRRRADHFIETFTKEYKWIEGLSIEVIGGLPAIHATVAGINDKLPLPNVSGAINRIIAICLTIASRERSIVLVDEMENGVYYKHHVPTWRSILNFARQYDAQLFTTTHNEEWLEALVEAANGEVDDIALWRMERDEMQPVLRQFAGDQAALGIRAGEVR